MSCISNNTTTFFFFCLFFVGGGGGIRTWRFEKCHGLQKLYIWPQQLGDDRKNLEGDKKNLY